MQEPCRLSTAVRIVLAVMVIVTWCAADGFGQVQAGYKAPRLAGTQHPDLNGIWQTLNSANYDIEPHD